LVKIEKWVIQMCLCAHLYTQKGWPPKALDGWMNQSMCCLFCVLVVSKGGRAAALLTKQTTNTELVLACHACFAERLVVQ
jgi:hypothetical protein